jgi:hypothetical protein
MSLIKAIQSKEEFFIEFTPEELATLDISHGDKFTWEIKEDGTIFLKKHAKLELDLSEFSKDGLAAICKLSVDQQIPVDEVIESLLKSFIDSRGLEALTKTPSSKETSKPKSSKVTSKVTKGKKKDMEKKAKKNKKKS